MKKIVENIICYWIPTALFIWGAFCLLKSYGYCEEIEQNSKYRLPVHLEYVFEGHIARSSWNPRKKNPSTQSQLAHWQEEYELHMFHANRCYQDAYDRAWYLPNITWRQRTKEAWIAGFSMVGASTPTLKLVMAISSLLMQYGLDCMDEYDYIQEKLKWAEYHFNECDKYAQLLHGGK